jgi:alanine dehydrogenase
MDGEVTFRFVKREDDQVPSHEGGAIRLGGEPNGPAMGRVTARRGHQVLVEAGAGLGSGLPDHDYLRPGADLVSGPEEIFARADLIVKVKEPQPSELKLIRRGQVIFTYFHLAADPRLTEALLASGATCVAYETLADDQGRLPLLTPMSEVAGRMSIQEGAKFLERPQMGRGILLGGVPGVAPAKVLVIGGGVVGANAILMALGMGADVTVLDRSVDALRALARQFGPALKTIYSTQAALMEHVLDADMVVGAVLVVGAEAPKLVTAEMVKRMRPGSVLVDVAIDQGGCFETSRPTTHAEPTYVVDGVVHYCVANMPGAVPRTSTYALNNVTLPYALALADRGPRKALLDNPNFLQGLNVCRGLVTYQAVANDLGYEFVDPAKALAS